jgi:hypothetical protein
VISPKGHPPLYLLGEFNRHCLKTGWFACVSHLLKDRSVLRLGKEIKVVSSDQILYVVSCPFCVGRVDSYVGKPAIEVGQASNAVLHDRL